MKKYPRTEEDKKRLENWHYHPPHGCQTERYGLINDTSRLMAQVIMDYCPPSRQRSLALSQCEMVRMWANAAIACNEAEDEK